MERINASDGRVTPLGALFKRAPTDTPATTEIMIDPRLALEEERQRVLHSGREEGLALGLEDARKQIDDAVGKARQELEDKQAAAHKRLEQAEQRLTALLQRLPDLIESIEEKTAGLAAELAYLSVLRVLGEATPAERIERISRQALAEIHQRPITIRVSDGDRDAVAALADGTTVQVESAARLQSGQCELDAGSGIHDTGLDVRLESLKQAFLRAAAGVETT